MNKNGLMSKTKAELITIIQQQQKDGLEAAHFLAEQVGKVEELTVLVDWLRKRVVLVPNAQTQAAMEEGNQLSGRFGTARELFDDLEEYCKGIRAVENCIGYP